MRKFRHRMISAAGIHLYIPIEYIQNTGTQYINTGFPGAKYDMDIDFAVVQWTSYGSVFGNYSSEPANSFRLIVSNSDNNQGYVSHDTKAGSSTSVQFKAKGTNNHVEYKGDILVQSNDVEKALPTVAGTANTTKIALFGTKVGTASSLRCKIYGFRLYEYGNRDNLLLDLIPVIRVADGKVCMYDKVSGNFFLNSGTGEFVAGPEIHGVLPVTYQLLDYAQSAQSDQVYVNTGVVPKSTTRIDLKVEYYGGSATMTAYQRMGWGSSSNQEAAIIGSYIPPNKTVAYHYFTWHSNWGTESEVTHTDIPAVDDVIRNISICNDWARIDDAEYEVVGRLTNKASAGQTLFLFSLHTEWAGGASGPDGYYNSYCNARIYHCDIYDGSVKIRNYYPAKRLSDNAVGLYDTVRHTFIYHTKLTAGSAI